VNDVDRMRIELDALRKTVRKLEIAYETKIIFNDDEREAQRIAEQLGFNVEIFQLAVTRSHRGAAPRRRIARELREKKCWAYSRIARALHCDPRSVRRLVCGE
jgi:DNA-directed RNA polymerase specialized sigma24 family protein